MNWKTVTRLWASLYYKDTNRVTVTSEGAMQRLVITAFLVTLCLLINPLSLLAASPPKAPTSAGGFSLNTSIENYPVENHANYLNEVIVTKLDGFRKGFITYGTCRNPGTILRVKLKYNDRSFKFFQDLLKRYKNKFGPKPKFSGDQFGNVKSWKWSFIGENGQRTTLVLQHNLKDSDESIGNMVKLSLPDLMDDERICFNERHSSESAASTSQSGSGKKLDWQELIPN